MPSPTIDFSKDEPRREYSAKYVHYLNEYHARLRRSVPAPSNAPHDAAGLLRGTRYHGRGTPLKGKGLPPADDKEALAGRQASHKVPGRSWQPSDVFHMSRPTTADDSLYRSSKRCVDVKVDAKKSVLRGGGVDILQPMPEPRRTRGAGTLRPDDTVEQTNRHVVNHGYGSGELLQSSSAMFTTRRTFVNLSRPSTAACDSIIRRRYSLPDNEPGPSKLDTVRMAKPLVTQPVNEEASRAVFYDSFDAYCWNKTRSLYGVRFRMG